MTLKHYPAVSAHGLRSNTVARLPAHSDCGTLTLLFQDEVGGLEIADARTAQTDRSEELDRTGDFLFITPHPGTIVVNVGYLLMRWSNGRWMNTVHRVTEPGGRKPLVSKGKQGGESAGELADLEKDNREMIPERYSIAFFSHPDPETMVEALPGCYDEKKPKRWKPINVGKYLKRKDAETHV